MFHNLQGAFNRAVRNGRRSLVRSLSRNRRGRRSSQAGFVLPTVVMVLLVVVLLTIAISLRSFDRSRDARFTRVSEAALSAAAPAVDRAQAKIQKALIGLSKDGITIDDFNIYKILTDADGLGFKLPDEEQLAVKFDIDNNGSIRPNGAAADDNGLLTSDDQLADNEQITTAWRFPVDTDNNGRLDSHIYYGIFFRRPSAPTAITPKRSPLDSRTQPIPAFSTSTRPECAFTNGASQDIVLPTGWTPMDGGLKKSFFVYITSVPFANATDFVPQPGDPRTPANDAEQFPGSPAFSALEYQQDWAQDYLNGTVYEGDLEITPGPAFNLNGKLYTQSNLITSPFTNQITLHQVSARNSCFYDENLAKILVAGNVINGMPGATQQNPVNVHLFQGTGNDPITSQISTTNQSITGTAVDGMFNDAAFRERLLALVGSQIGNAETTDPQEVQEAVNRQSAIDPTKDREDVRRDVLSSYFAQRMRKVPYVDVPIGGDAVGGQTAQGSGETLRPPDAWSNIASSNVTLVASQLNATEPEEQETSGVESLLGDRILAGNNLPALTLSGNKWVPTEFDLANDKWSDDSPRTRVTRLEPFPEAGDNSRNGFWEKAAATAPLQTADGIGGLRIVTAGGVYERLNSFLLPPRWDNPTTAVVEDLLIFDDPATPGIAETLPIVWPDTMPMSPLLNSQVYSNTGLYNPDGSPVATPTPPINASARWGTPDPLTFTPPTTPLTGTIDPLTRQYAKGDLRMRASAVYHYAQDAFDPSGGDVEQRPIACVSSYYDPSTSITARNPASLPFNPAVPNTTDAGGRSNNGIAYTFPGRPAISVTLNNTTGLFSGGGIAGELAKQANYVFPNGRFANGPLREALENIVDGDPLTLADQGAIDSTICSLAILGTPGAGAVTRSITFVPDSAIREITLLNAREIAANKVDLPATNIDETFTLANSLGSAGLNGNALVYDLPLADRQPLEIRMTRLDLNLMRAQGVAIGGGTTAPAPEFLLPNSGIIYATRDDALPDRSNRDANAANNGIDEDKSEELSPTDFILDPTRRSNGILLVNGGSLDRVTGPNNPFDEKGLTLVSNLPVYVQANFNTHSGEEFTAALTANWSNFYTRTGLNTQFACRANTPGRTCTETSDNWRPATIIADAVTVISNGFRFGFRNEGDFDLRNSTSSAIVGYDLNGNGNITSAIITDPAVDEATFGFDLNGNSTVNDPGVLETQISAKAARRLNGFNGYNGFAINGLSSNAAAFDINSNGTLGETADRFTDANYSGSNNANFTGNSSYFNNFVTPIQRRVNFPEYVMEICRKLPVSACGPADWVIGIDAATVGQFDGEVETSAGVESAAVGVLLSGTTSRPPLDPNDQRYPRRVAFLRYSGTDTNAARRYKLVLDGNNAPIPLGINSSATPSTVNYYSYNSITLTETASDIRVGGSGTSVPVTNGVPPATANTLWFTTTTSTTNPTALANTEYDDTGSLHYQSSVAQNPPVTNVGGIQHPQLVPVLQIHATTQGPQAAFPGSGSNNALSATRWIPNATAANSMVNANIVTSDSPGRPGETGGGMQNIVRFIEDWENPVQTTTILGSFIQSDRSRYATAPYLGILGGIANTIPVFDYDIRPAVSTRYNTNNGAGGIAYFQPPTRNWGFDVGILYQIIPDLFTQNFATLRKGANGVPTPNEYFREVGRDDPWVKGLLCAARAETSPTPSNNPTIPRTSLPQDFCEDYGG